MNFRKLRSLFLLNVFFDLEYMVKNGLMIIDLEKFVFFPELNYSGRLKDLIYISDMKCFGSNTVRVDFQYSQKCAISAPFSSREEAMEYMEVLTFFLNLLCAVPKKS
jgi:hypothetical protein